MRKQEADAWVLETLRQIRAIGPFETTHVELKREVSKNPYRFAKQLAGMANAAGWDPVLLLIGIDEHTQEIVGVDRSFSVGDWYAQVRSEFEYGIAPEISYHNFIEWEAKTISCVVFDTDNPPYVFGKGKAGSSRQVPWRVGTNTEDAGRLQLLRLLVPKARQPEIEIRRAELKKQKGNELQFVMELFVYPPLGQTTVIPFHRIEVRLSDESEGIVDLPTNITLVPTNVNASLARLLDSTISIEGPSRLQLVAFGSNDGYFDPSSISPTVFISIKPAHFSESLTVAVALSPRQHPDFAGYWELPEHHGRNLDTHKDQSERIRRQLEAAAGPPFINPFPPIPGPRRF